MTSSTRIRLAEPFLGEAEKSNVLRCFQDNWIAAAGSFVSQFESELESYTGCGHAIAVSSGTAALHLALSAAGVVPGDEVLVSDLSFIAPAHAICYVGAQPVFIGPELTYWQMDAGKVSDFLTTHCRRRADGCLVNEASGRKIGAIVPVHILGHPCDMDAIFAIAEEHQIPVVEDAAESLGAAYRDRPVGRTTGIACLSFNGNKTMTAGGGGAVLTSDDDVANRIRHLANQAKVSGTFVHDVVGYNYRISNLHAAVGLAQLKRLPELISRKRAISLRYEGAFAEVAGLTMAPEAPWARSATWLSSVRIDSSLFGRSAKGVVEGLAAVGIEARSLWAPLHTNPSMTDGQAFGCEGSITLSNDVVCLPSSCGLEADEQQVVIDSVMSLAVRDS